VRGVAGPRLADVIVKAHAVYSMDEARTTFRSLAIRDGWIVAASGEEAGLDGLASAGRAVVDARGPTLLPALSDRHEHQLESARDMARVRLVGARSLGDLAAPNRERGAPVAAGSDTPRPVTPMLTIWGS
jgi:predicted amidohydrolase YtcJ